MKKIKIEKTEFESIIDEYNDTYFYLEDYVMQVFNLHYNNQELFHNHFLRIECNEKVLEKSFSDITEHLQNVDATLELITNNLVIGDYQIKQLQITLLSLQQKINKKIKCLQMNLDYYNKIKLLLPNSI